MSENLFGLTVAADKGLDDLQCQRLLSENRRYDCVSCLIDVAMSFLAFGPWHFVGVKWGTILCALLNGWIIGQFSAFYEKHWTFYDRFPLRKYFVPDAAQPSAQR